MNQTHCGVDGFSPQAPDCELQTVPEPGTLLLVLVALMIWRTLRAIAARHRNHGGVTR